MSRTPGNKTFTFVVAVNAPAGLETVVMQYVNSAMRRYERELQRNANRSARSPYFDGVNVSYTVKPITGPIEFSKEDFIRETIRVIKEVSLVHDEFTQVERHNSRTTL